MRCGQIKKKTHPLIKKQVIQKNVQPCRECLYEEIKSPTLCICCHTNGLISTLYPFSTLCGNP